MNTEIESNILRSKQQQLQAQQSRKEQRQLESQNKVLLANSAQEKSELSVKSKTVGVKDNLNQTSGKPVDAPQKSYEYPQLKYFMRQQGPDMFDEEELAELEAEEEQKKQKQVVMLNVDDPNEWAALMQFDLQLYNQEVEERKKRQAQLKE